MTNQIHEPLQHPDAEQRIVGSSTLANAGKVAIEAGLNSDAGLAGANEVGAIEDGVGMEHKTHAHIASVEAYFDKFMANPHRGNLEGDASKQAGYREVFTDLVSHYFDLDLLMQDRYPGLEYNPILDELGGMMASLDHNAGVYYAETEVADLFVVTASHILDNKELQDEFRQAETAGNVKGIDDAFQEGVKKTFSLDREVTLAVVKDENGAWRVAGESEYSGEQDFTPLEIIRQDNADKGGAKKYRFRAATYTRQQDDLHSHPVVDGWFTSEWPDEPNYWSEKLRAALVDGLTATEMQLQESGIRVLLITEGGILKGTSTEGTDIDTECIILGDSIDDFEQAHAAIDVAFPTVLERLPFGLKKGEAIRPYFYDRSSGKDYYRDPKSGEYTTYGNHPLFEGRYVFTIRKNEKGVGVTTSKGFDTVKKPTDVDANGYAFVSIDLESGDTRELSGEALDRYKETQDHLRKKKRDDSLSWVW